MNNVISEDSRNLVTIHNEEHLQKTFSQHHATWMKEETINYLTLQHNLLSCWRIILNFPQPKYLVMEIKLCGDDF